MPLRCVGLHAAALLAAGLLAPAGCQHAVSSQDSIYMSSARPADPAITRPHLGRGYPAAEDGMPAATAPAPLGLAVRTDGPAYRPVDIGERVSTLRVAIEGLAPVAGEPGQPLRIVQDVSAEPTVRFDAQALGEFRSASVQIYPLVEGRLARPSGVVVSNQGDQPALAPGRDVRLTSQDRRLLFRNATTGEPIPSWPGLTPGTEYEIHFIIGGTKSADTLEVRVHTASKASPERP